MKKFFLSIVTFIYLMMSSGIAMEVHYCMGKKAGIDFYKLSEAKCGKCGMTEQKSGCCHDEHKFLKLANDHKNVSGISIPFTATFIAAQIFFSASDLFLPYTLIASAQAYSPPDILQNDRCIQNCVFRI